MVVNLLAAQRNDVNRLMHAFLENQDLNRAGYDGTTLLHVAAGHNSFDAVQFLVEKATVNVDQRDRRPNAPGLSARSLTPSLGKS